MTKKVFFLLLSSFLLHSQISLAAQTRKNSSFEKWKKSFIKRSMGKGVPRSFMRKQLSLVKYDKKIIKKDRNQITSNKKVNYKKWMKKWLGPDRKRIAKGKKLLKKHAKLLSKIEKKYKVDREVIVSLWGVETFYGKITGTNDIISALSTLAYDKRRRKFFEKELFSALKILHQGHIKRDQFKGSWAGALGQCQFMPSSFLAYAQDFDGDGKKDIWNNPGDIFASIAFYLKKARWKENKSIGKLTVKKLRSPASKKRLEKIPFQNSPHLVRGANYKTLMRWNRSSLFAALNIVLMDAFLPKKR